MKDANALRQLIEAMEAEALRDPNRIQKPVICVREVDVDPALQAETWGPDWRKSMNRRHCALCRAPVIIRPVFFENLTVICQPCAPEFLTALFRKDAQA